MLFGINYSPLKIVWLRFIIYRLSETTFQGSNAKIYKFTSNQQFDDRLKKKFKLPKNFELESTGGTTFKSHLKAF